jgi:hypothetical protein
MELLQAVFDMSSTIDTGKCFTALAYSGLVGILLYSTKFIVPDVI